LTAQAAKFFFSAGGQDAYDFASGPFSTHRKTPNNQNNRPRNALAALAEFDGTGIGGRGEQPLKPICAGNF
jgi:hypothetical protein